MKLRLNIVWILVKTLEGKSLVLCGNVGNGKTHLAVSILNNFGPFKRKVKYKDLYGNEKESEHTIEPERLFINADHLFPGTQ